MLLDDIFNVDLFGLDSSLSFNMGLGLHLCHAWLQT